MEKVDSSVQHIKDFRLAIEFKYLMKHAPAGVYLLPEFDNIRVLHGVIFVRRGLYRDGIFRFRIDLPPQYNDFNAHPMITFTPPIFNPLVDPATGRLDLSIDENLKEWHSERHFIVTALTFLKKVFYRTNYDGFVRMPHPEAKRLFDEDKDEFLIRVNSTVQESLHRVYDVQTAVNPLVFTEPKPAHAELVREILFKHRKPGSTNEPAEDLASSGISTASPAFSKPLSSESDTDIANLDATTPQTTSATLLDMSSDSMDRSALALEDL